MHGLKLDTQGFTPPLEKKKKRKKSLELCTLYTVGTTHPETLV